LNCWLCAMAARVTTHNCNRHQYSKTNEIHFWYLIYFELTNEQPLHVSSITWLIFRNNTWYIACVLCQLPAPGLEWNCTAMHSQQNIKFVTDMLRMVHEVQDVGVCHKSNFSVITAMWLLLWEYV
jgi:hypothetical protein